MHSHERFLAEHVSVCDWLYKAGAEKALPLSYLFAADANDNNSGSSSDATALIYKLHTSDTIE